MHAYLFPGLTLSPTVLRRVFALIPEARWDEPAAPDRFTPREVIAHLADWEPIFLVRMKLGVDKPGSEVAVYDEGHRAIEQGYAHSDPRTQLDRFEASRALLVRYLDGLDSAAFQSRFLHPERGEMTVYDQANMLLGHDLYHLEQLTGFIGDKLADVW